MSSAVHGQRSAESRPAVIAAFLVVLAAGLITAALPPLSVTTIGGAVPVVALTALFGLFFAVMTARWSVPVSAVAALALFPLIAVARELGGLATSGWTPLMLLPLLWIVLHGTRTHLYLAALGATSVFVLPWVTVGPPAFMAVEWRAAVLWALVIVLVCPIVQRRVQSLRVALRDVEALAGQLSSVVRAATEHAVIALDLDGRVAFFNTGAERVVGCAEGDIVGTDGGPVLHSLGPDDDRPGNVVRHGSGHGHGRPRHRRPVHPALGSAAR